MQHAPSLIRSVNAPASLTLMTVIAIVSIAGIKSKKVFLQFVMHPYGIIKLKEFYRIVTGDLVHNDVMHLFINEYMMFLICVNLEELLRQHSTFGSLQFLGIYFTSYATGAVYSIARHRNDFNFSSAGASGSIMGCMMSFMVLKPSYIAVYLPVFGGLKNQYTALIFILILIVYQRKRSNLVFNHEMHFFGALGGLIATFTMFPEIIHIVPG